MGRRLLGTLAVALLVVSALLRTDETETALRPASRRAGVSPAPATSPATAKPAPSKLQPGLDCATEAVSSLTVVPRTPDDLAALEGRVRALGGTVVARTGLKDGVPRLRIRLKGTALRRLADFAEVSWVERHVPYRLLNDVAVESALMNVATVRTTYGLTGKGQVVTTSDSGIDTGDWSTLHADLAPNLIGFALAKEGDFEVTDGGSTWTTRVSRCDISGHGTHTAGSIVGTGARSDGQFKGAAYEAKLWAWFCGGEDDYVYTPDDFADVFRPAALGPTNAYLHSASWGGDANVYDTSSQAIDTWCWHHPDFLPVFAAANNGKDYSVAAQGGAKNVLCVGATQSTRFSGNPDALASFSSRGPMPDGRIKPDICAPGTYIVSTRSSVPGAKTGGGVYDDYYNYNSGTSMATPLTAGTMALIRQWLVEKRGFTNAVPSAALMKAIVTGGATRLGSAAPNKDFGWGLVNLGESLYPTNGLSVALCDRLPVTADADYAFEVTTTNTAPLDVQLCWVDYPANPREAANGAKTLKIDLDLVVSNETTGAVWTPDDHLNNVEGVRIDAAEPATYTIVVRDYASEGVDLTSGGAVAVYVRGAGVGEIVPVSQYVTVTVSAEGGADHTCSPAVGSHSYEKGSTVTFTAGKYAEDPGADYRYSSSWGLDLERYELLEATNAVTLTLTGDTNVVWHWSEQPSQVGLWLESCDDFNGVTLYPGNAYGAGYWIDYAHELEIVPDDSPMTTYYASGDEGWTVPVNGWMYGQSSNWWWPRRLTYGTLRFTSFYVMDEAGSGGYVRDATNHYRIASSVTLPMTSFTAVDFGYADETAMNSTVQLPFWWWARQFWGAYANGQLDAEATYSTGDPDGDGFANRAEYEEPTDPWDDASFPFRFTDFSLTNMTFIGSVKGKLAVEHVEKLGGSWSNVWDTTTASRTSVTNTYVPKQTGASGFYRVRYGNGND